jgi:hypothetical protein
MRVDVTNGSENMPMTRSIEYSNALRRCGIAAVVAAAVCNFMGVAPPASASGIYIFDNSYYRPMRGRERTVFRNPVGKLGPGVTRRLPPLTPRPAEFDFGGAGPITIDPPPGSAASARRSNPASEIAPLTPIPPVLTPQVVTPPVPTPPVSPPQATP